MREGVIKFELEHRDALPEGTADLESLVVRRHELIERGLIGQFADRYDGVGFGNISVRVDGGFMVSGTQTSGLANVDARRHFAKVISWDSRRNALVSEGPVKPSSESMTHAMVYEANAGAGCVLHVHSKKIWAGWQRLSLDVTETQVEYGTPEMAAAVRAIAGHSESSAIAMLGHEDGVLVWGGDVDEAFDRLLELHERALTVA